jgi:hypothetical protein
VEGGDPAGLGLRGMIRRRSAHRGELREHLEVAGRMVEELAGDHRAKTNGHAPGRRGVQPRGEALVHIDQAHVGQARST